MKKKKSSVQTPNSLWGGRFAKGPAAIMAEINASIGFDRHLFRQDIAGSRAHLKMLVEQGIVSPADGKKILKGLDQVEVEIAAGKMQFKPTLEDIHMHVEARLSELIGDPAGRLHTARSRNDQVALDVHLYVRDQVDHITYALKQLLGAFLDRAEQEAATVLPGFTHLQSAQPVTFGHHLMAYVEMLGRDLERFENVRHRTNESPLGAAALAGTSFPIDRQMTAKALGFRGAMRNSMDAVASRDFAAEFLAAGAILSVHLSRFAEEIVLWMSDAFGFIRLSDAFTTGSSIMPQKKNPDAAELVRGKTGRMIGHLNAMLVTLKGLPLTYGKDMQEDKEPLIDAAATLALTITATTGMVRDMTVNRDRMRKATEVGHITATDLADWLVRTLGLPFRRAHHITGSLVKRADELGCQLAALPLSEMRAVEAGITGEVYKVLTVDRSVASRTSFGGTAPKRVREAVKAARKRLKL